MPFQADSNPLRALDTSLSMVIHRVYEETALLWILIQPDFCRECLEDGYLLSYSRPFVQSRRRAVVLMAHSAVRAVVQNTEPAETPMTA